MSLNATWVNRFGQDIYDKLQRYAADVTVGTEGTEVTQSVGEAKDIFAIARATTRVATKVYDRIYYAYEYIWEHQTKKGKRVQIAVQAVDDADRVYVLAKSVKKQAKEAANNMPSSVDLASLKIELVEAFHALVDIINTYWPQDMRSVPDASESSETKSRKRFKRLSGRSLSPSSVRRPRIWNCSTAYEALKHLEGSSDDDGDAYA